MADCEKQQFIIEYRLAIAFAYKLIKTSIYSSKQTYFFKRVYNKNKKYYQCDKAVTSLSLNKG